MRIEFEFTGEEKFFQGHFPSFPILPGVTQLGKAVEAAQKLRGSDAPVKSVRKMKFVKVIEPREKVTLELEELAADRVAYRYLKGEELCSSGVLQF